MNPSLIYVDLRNNNFDIDSLIQSKLWEKSYRLLWNVLKMTHYVNLSQLMRLRYFND